MKAIQLRHPAGLEQLELVDLPDPGAPGAGQVRVRIHASSLNGHDLAVALGWLPAADGRILMSDGAGVVEAIGPGVTELAVGDAVVSTFFPQWPMGDSCVDDFSATPGDGADGFACEVVVRPVNAFTRAPSGYSHAEAATLTTAGLTAWRALVPFAQVKAGDSVLVMGTGGVAVFGLQFAKAMGATVIATSSSDDKLARAQALGADHLINYRRTQQWSRAVLDATNGRGVDHVIETGGPATLPQSIAACRVGGLVAMIGVMTGMEGVVPTALLMTRQVRLQGFVVGSRQHQIDMVRGIEAIGLKPVIDQSFGLEALADAFRFQQAGRHFGKLVLEF